MKTKLSASLAAAAIAALALAGCSSADDTTSPTATPTTEDTAATQAAADAALESVAWSMGDDGVPVVTFDQPFNVGTTAARMIQDGDGDELAKGDVITLDYTVTSGDDGSVSYSTYDTSGQPESIMLADNQIDPALIDILVGAHVGANFLYAAVDTSTDPQSSVIMAVTVSKAITPLTRAEGTPVTPPAGLPAVTLADDGTPSVSIPDTDPPSDLVAQTLIQGDGAEIAEGDSITVNYTGWLWDGDGTAFDSSWEAGTPATFTIATGSLIDGWVQGLVGETVGSQVLLIIPPDLGYGDDGSQDGSIPGGASLVFVVDILAAS